MQRGLAITLILFVAVTLRPVEIEVAEALPIAAAPHEPIIGVASGDAGPGAMTPTGNGRFTIDDRISRQEPGAVGVGRRSQIFTGQFRSVEDWVLESPRMIGSHRSAVTIRSDLGTVTLQLRGRRSSPRHQARGGLALDRRMRRSPGRGDVHGDVSGLGRRLDVPPDLRRRGTDLTLTGA